MELQMSRNFPPYSVSQPQQKACQRILFCKRQDPPYHAWITSVKPSQGRHGFVCFTALESTWQRAFECLRIVSALLTHAWCCASSDQAVLCRAEEVLAEGLGCSREWVQGGMGLVEGQEMAGAGTGSWAGKRWRVMLGPGRLGSIFMTIIHCIL